MCISQKALLVSQAASAQIKGTRSTHPHTSRGPQAAPEGHRARREGSCRPVCSLRANPRCATTIALIRVASFDGSQTNFVWQS